MFVRRCVGDAVVVGEVQRPRRGPRRSRKMGSVCLWGCGWGPSALPCPPRSSAWPRPPPHRPRQQRGSVQAGLRSARRSFGKAWSRPCPPVCRRVIDVSPRGSLPLPWRRGARGAASGQTDGAEMGRLRGMEVKSGRADSVQGKACEASKGGEEGGGKAFFQVVRSGVQQSVAVCRLSNLSLPLKYDMSGRSARPATMHGVVGVAPSS